MPTQMHNRLINLCGALSEKKLINGQRFNEIVEGTDMSGQLKGGQIFHFWLGCTRWFAANHSPKTDDCRRKCSD